MITPALLSALILAACAFDSGQAPAGGASPSPAGRPAPPPRAVREPGCAPLFASPSGEPFRVSADQGACPIRVWFDQADADHDGALTRGEFRADALRFFHLLDVNDDGVIGPGELKRYEQLIFPELAYGDRLAPIAARDTGVVRIALAGQFSGGGQQQSGGRSADGTAIDTAPNGPSRGEFSSQGAGAYGLLAEPEPVTASDLNFDGRVTQAEFATRADQRFDTLDTAESGRLTYADLKARMPKVRGGRDRRRGSPPS